MHISPALRGLLFIGLMSGVFLFGGAWTIYRQRTGTPVQASVLSCSGGRRSFVCSGSWMVDGRVRLGEIEGATRADLGQRIEVRAWDARAIKPGLRLPIILFTIGFAILALGARWWKREAPRNR